MFKNIKSKSAEEIKSFKTNILLERDLKQSGWVKIGAGVLSPDLFKLLILLCRMCLFGLTDLCVIITGTLQLRETALEGSGLT